MALIYNLNSFGTSFCTTHWQQPEDATVLATLRNLFTHFQELARNVSRQNLLLQIFRDMEYPLVGSSGLGDP